MNELGQIMLSIGATGILCAIVRHMVGQKGMIGSVMKLATGIVMLLAVVHPLMNLDIESITAPFTSYAVDAQGYVDDGTEAYRDALINSMKQRTVAYILEEAKALNLDITVDVQVSDDPLPIPTQVTIEGNAAPYAKQQLTAWITENLNISREAQHWI